MQRILQLFRQPLNRKIFATPSWFRASSLALVGLSLLLTGAVNIEAFTGRVVAVGDMVLVRVNPDGSHVSHQVLPSPRP